MPKLVHYELQYSQIRALDEPAPAWYCDETQKLGFFLGLLLMPKHCKYPILRLNKTLI